jgi:hypothetical protein
MTGANWHEKAVFAEMEDGPEIVHCLAITLRIAASLSSIRSPLTSTTTS